MCVVGDEAHNFIDSKCELEKTLGMADSCRSRDLSQNGKLKLQYFPLDKRTIDEKTQETCY
jgi:hypothetical protein